MRTALALLCLFLLTVGGCYRYDVGPIEPFDPFPYSFCDSSRPQYPKTLDGARRFVSDTRSRWTYEHNAGAQYPHDSCRALSGDCDDFAIMLAYYLQEYWGFDTFIVLIRVDGSGHACAYVARSSGVAVFSNCGPVPILQHADGRLFDPLDWTPCPGWTWTSFGGVLTFEWYELAGNSQLSLD